MFLRVSGWFFSTPTGALILAILAQIGFGFFPSQGDVTGVAAGSTGPSRTICGLSAECLVVGFENVASASTGCAGNFMSISGYDCCSCPAEMVGEGVVDIAVPIVTIEIKEILISVVKPTNQAFSTYVAFITSNPGVAYIINKQRMLTFNTKVDTRRGQSFHNGS